jgi:hypothetical protein
MRKIPLSIIIVYQGALLSGGGNSKSVLVFFFGSEHNYGHTGDEDPILENGNLQPSQDNKINIINHNCSLTTCKI